MAGWIVTAPRDLNPNLYELFFQETYKFLEERYGHDNVVSAVCHNDESGTAHLHFCFIPATEDLRHGGEKICANSVLNRTELRNFHPSLQKYLNDKKIEARILNGATAGGNRSVKELKQNRDRELKIERRLEF